MKVFVTLEFEIPDEDLPTLRQAGWDAAEPSFTDRAEWDEYRLAGGCVGREPHEYDLVEIVVAGLWAAAANVGSEFLSLEDTETRTDR
jgi:hypothetical protein